MYGLITRIVANEGDRDALVRVLLEGSRDMPGCLSYVVARDAAADDSVWVTEVWESRARHQASLSLPAVQSAMASGRPLVAEFAERVETGPAGGVGLPD